MRVNVQNLEVLLAKLDKLTYVSEGSDTLTTKEGFVVSYDTKLHHSEYGGSFPSIQLILRVRYNGRHITSWGCGDIEDTKLVANWFLTKEVEAQRFEHADEKKVEELGKNIFETL